MPRILVVDDELHVLKVVTALLGRVGHECVGTTSALEALVLALSFRPDLLVVDVAMPEMSGAALVREIHARPGSGRPPVVFVSGYGELGGEPPPDVRMRFVAKPFTTAELAEAISALLVG